jgi:hypothetical protein
LFNRFPFQRRHATTSGGNSVGFGGERLAIEGFVKNRGQNDDIHVSVADGKGRFRTLHHLEMLRRRLLADVLDHRFGDIERVNVAVGLDLVIEQIDPTNGFFVVESLSTAGCQFDRRSVQRPGDGFDLAEARSHVGSYRVTLLEPGPQRLEKSAHGAGLPVPLWVVCDTTFGTFDAEAKHLLFERHGASQTTDREGRQIRPDTEAPGNQGIRTSIDRESTAEPLQGIEIRRHFW